MAITANPARYIRPGAVAQPIDLCDGSELFYCEGVANDGRVRYFADLFLGKSAKNANKYYFRSAEQRAQHIGKAIDARKSQHERRAAEMAKRKTFRTDLAAGDVVYRTWGYDQTNTDMWEILEVSASGKSVTIVKIKQEVHEDGFMSGSAKPVKGKHIGAPFRAQVGPHGVCMDRGHAHKLERESVRVSWYA